MKNYFIKALCLILTFSLLLTMFGSFGAFAQNGDESGNVGFGEMLRYAEFTLNTNAPTRTYIIAVYGYEQIDILSWADSRFSANMNHKIRIEADTRSGSLASGEGAKVRVFVDGSLKKEFGSAHPDESLGLTLMAYKTPAVTLSNPEYGYIDEDGNKTVWLNRFMSSADGSAEEILFNGDEMYNDAKAEFYIAKGENNSGSSFMQKYDGTRLSYHGRDSANNGNSDITIFFGKLIASEDDEEPEMPEEPLEPVDPYEAHVAGLIQTNELFYGFEDLTEENVKTSFFDGMMFADSGGEVSVVQLPEDTYPDGKVLRFDTQNMVDGAPRMVFRNLNGYEIVEIGFDIMMELSDADKKINVKMNTGWIGDGISINKNGIIGGFGTGVSENYELKAGNWHRIRLLFDCNSDKFIFLADDTVIYNLNCDVDYTFVDYMELLSGYGVICFDNICAKVYMARPSVSDVSSYDNTVELTMNTPIQTINRVGGKTEYIDFLPLITIEQDGKMVAVDDVEYNDSLRKFIITTELPLRSSLTYTVNLSEEICSVSGASVAEDTKVSFSTDASDFDITKVSVRNGKITATAVNKTDEEKTLSMIVAGKNEDGKYINSAWTLSQPISGDNAKIVFDASDWDADSFEIVFVTDNSECIPVKNHIYGGQNIVIPTVEGVGDPFISLEYDASAAEILLSGRVEANKGDVAIIAIAPNAENMAEDIPFDDYNPPEITAFAICGANGSLMQSIKLPDDLEPGQRRAYVITGYGFQSAPVTLYSGQQAEEITDICNSAVSSSELAEYFSNGDALTILGVSDEDANVYVSEIARAVIASKPESGYSFGTLSDRIKYTIVKERLMSGESGDEVMKQYSDCLGVSYVDYMDVSPEVRTQLEILIALPGMDATDIGFESLVILSEIRVAAASSWSALKEFMTTNDEILGIDLSAGGTYDELSSADKAQLFKNIRTQCANAVTLHEVADLFEEEADALKRKSQKTNKPSGGGGGGGSSSVTPIQTVIAGNDTSAGATKIEFTDVSGHFAEEAIQFLSAKKIINGYPDGTFRPDDFITRSEFSKIVALAFNFTPKYEVHFDDVSEDSWYFNDVSNLASNGIIKGDGDKFYPLHNITREDAAVIVYRIISLQSVCEVGEISFDDADQISTYAADAVGAMSKAGVILGSNNYFYPKKQITRGEAAVMLYRSFKIMTEVVQ